MSLNDRIQRLFDIKTDRAELAKQDKALKSELELLEADIRQELFEMDVPKYTSNAGTVTPTQREFVEVTDMDAFLGYCEDNGEMHLLVKPKPAQAGTIEQIKLMGTENVPGVEIGFKNTLSARKA